MEAWEGEEEEAKAEVATVGTVTAAVAMGLVEEEAVVEEGMEVEVATELGLAAGSAAELEAGVESVTAEGVAALEGETGLQKVVGAADLAGREGLVGLVAAPSRKQ